MDSFSAKLLRFWQRICLAIFLHLFRRFHLLEVRLVRKGNRQGCDRSIDRPLQIRAHSPLEWTLAPLHTRRWPGLGCFGTVLLCLQQRPFLLLAGRRHVYELDKLFRELDLSRVKNHFGVFLALFFVAFLKLQVAVHQVHGVDVLQRLEVTHTHVCSDFALGRCRRRLRGQHLRQTLHSSYSSDHCLPLRGTSVTRDFAPRKCTPPREGNTKPERLVRPPP
mmetsp:Transcript_15322/g.39005  ORF Transcript_15322/g.39005 Transcript_15322/m.39005 type:complete len:221 (-) Transcript_15322:278-940(-)